MLTTFRKLLDNWLVRGFFVLLIAVFVFWGISSAVTNVGGSNAIAKVGGVALDPGAVQSEYQRELAAYAQRNGGGQPAPSVRAAIAQNALGQAIDRQAMALEVKHLGVAAPPSALRQQIFAMTVFQGPGGTFDKARFNQVLQQNNLNPNQFMADLASGLAASQVVEAVTAGATAPAPLVKQVFDYIGQARVAAYVQLPFAAATPPAPPSDAVLRRYWRNHPRRFSTPALRQVQMVVLSPALIAPHMTVTPREIAAAYAEDKASFTAPVSRSVEIITASDAASAAALQAQWSKGASWAAMKQAAQAATATAVTFNDASLDQFPSGRLAKAVFAAKPNVVTGPVTGALGSYVFEVTKVMGGTQPLAAVSGQIKNQIALRKARHRMDAAVTKVQDALAAATPLDKLPASLGLVAVEGELDAQGNTAAGKPAPVPGPPALRQAIISQAFTAPLGAAPHLESAPDDSYYALSVIKEIPPALRPYHKVASHVLADWTGAQVARTQEVAAAGLLAAVKSGKTLDQAASAAGLPVSVSQPITRTKPPADLPAKLVPVLFATQVGHVTMVETQQGFVVAVLKSVTDPKPGSDKATEAKIATALSTGMQTDTLQSFATALRSRYRVTVNQKLLSQISQ
jgi:peptidyl-prolyl cis-trans isomerase D